MKNYPSSEDIHVRLDKFLGPYIGGTTWFSKTLNKWYSVHSMQYNSIDWNLVNLCGSNPHWTASFLDTHCSQPHGMDTIIQHRDLKVEREGTLRTQLEWLRTYSCPYLIMVLAHQHKQQQWNTTATQKFWYGSQMCMESVLQTRPACLFKYSFAGELMSGGGEK